MWEGMLAFAKRQRVLSPEQYQIVDVRTSCGMRRAMLFRPHPWHAIAVAQLCLAYRRRASTASGAACMWLADGVLGTELMCGLTASL